MSAPTGRSHYLATGVRLHFVEAGPPDGPLTLLLHGFPESSHAWRHQIGPLAAAGLHVVAPDQRGYALSDKPRGIGSYRLDRLAEDAAALIEAFGAERAHVVGHDWGGAVAWYLAAARPQCVERLAILNVPHPVVMRRHLRSDRAQLRRSWYMFFFQLPWLPEWWLRHGDWRNLKRMFRATSRPGTFSDEDLARYAEDCARPRALRSMIHWYRAALLRPPPRPASWRVQAPTRIVWGAQDRAIGRDMVEPSAALCDDADICWIEEAGHWVQHEEPERVGELLLEHLTGARSATEMQAPETVLLSTALPRTNR
ncbi:MAG TPA: alpha/beta fold hydrolase [Thermoanaerobaculia bacterium]|nr:alpha/beta fold hydrolase [Thermoanaerobaculia bacterium]